MRPEAPPPPTGRPLVAAAAFVVVVAGMRAAASLIVPFLLAAFIAVICAPALSWLTRRRVPSGAAVAIVVAGALAGAALVGTFLGTSLNDFTHSLPEYTARLQERTASLRAWLAGRGFDVSHQVILDQLDPGAAMQVVGNALAGLGNVLTNAFMILLTVVFILLEASGLPAKFRAAFGGSGDTLEFFTHFIDGVNRYLAIKTAVSAATGVIIAAILAFIGLDHALLWGLVAFLLNFVPNIGSIIAAVPPVLLGLVQLGPGGALLIAAVFLAANVLIGSVIEPRLMGRSLGLSTLVVFLSLVFWGWILGPVGMLLSVPLTMIVKIALQSHRDTEWIAILLGSEPAPVPAPAAPPAEGGEE